MSGHSKWSTIKHKKGKADAKRGKVFTKIIREITYEGCGPGGVALLIDVLTDNKNRTAAEIGNALSKGGGNLGEGMHIFLF